MFLISFLQVSPAASLLLSRSVAGLVLPSGVDANAGITQPSLSTPFPPTGGIQLQTRGPGHSLLASCRGWWWWVGWRGVGVWSRAEGPEVSLGGGEGLAPLQALKGKESEVSQSCLILCDHMDCSLPGSSIHGISQARILEWVAISFSRGSS